MNIPDKIFLSQTDVKLASRHGSASTYIPYVSEMVHNRLMAERDAEIERLQESLALIAKEASHADTCGSGIRHKKETLKHCARHARKAIGGAV